MAEFNFKQSNIGQGPDELHFSTKRDHVTGYINVIKFRDRNTNHIVMYVPGFELSSYGDTKEEAAEMMKECVREVLQMLGGLSPKQLQDQLAEWGWKKHKFRNKDFSKVAVDVKGQLQNFNAVEDSIERLALVA